MENIKFSEDVLVEILCRLPDEALVRSKCVCREWYDLISQVCIPRVSHNPPTVCLTFGIRKAFEDVCSKCGLDIDRGTPPNNYMEYCWLDRGKNDVGLKRFLHAPCATTLPFVHSELCLLDSCNGLLLFVRPVCFQYYVCNPTTKQFALIPDVQRHQKFSILDLAFYKEESLQSDCYASLAFNPMESSHYKVVRVARFKDAPLSLDIYFSEADQWVHHTVEIDPLVCRKRWHQKSVYLRGTLYRMSHSFHLICFHLDEVSACAIELPSPGSESKFHLFIGTIGISDGQLCYAAHNKKTLFVWFLHDRCDAGEWIVKYNICISDIDNQLDLSIAVKSLCRLRFDFHPGAFCSSSDVIFFCMSDIIISYNFESRNLKEVYKSPDSRHIRIFCPIFAHVRCLVPLINAGKMDCATQPENIAAFRRFLWLTPAYDPAKQTFSAESSTKIETLSKEDQGVKRMPQIIATGGDPIFSDNEVAEARKLIQRQCGSS